MSNFPIEEYERFKRISEILKDRKKNEYTQDDIEYLSKVGILRQNQVDVISSNKDLFQIAVPDQLFNATRRLKSSIQSPYQTDKDLGLDLEDGLSSLFPVNSRCVTFEIRGENSVGYLSVSPNGSMAEIYKIGDKVEEFTVSDTVQDSMLYKVASNFEFQEIDIEEVIVNKPSHEYDEVFYSKTGYRSLGDFIEIKMSELANQLINKYEVLDNLHSSGLNCIAKFYEGSIDKDSLHDAVIASKIYDALKDGSQFSETERSAYLDQMTYKDRFGFDSSIDELNTISTETLCKLSCYDADRLSTPNKKVAVFQLEDGTAIVSMNGGLNQYKPDELLKEFDSIYNTPELLTMVDMYYLGECKIEIQQKAEEQLEQDPEPEVKKTRTIKPGR
ncbi:hypothetical protein SOX05_08630 [Pseudomonas putida]|nr:hypothetical protein [Pseudomonas putida]MDY4319326.1 hypothetical protein [Pseudomonas putida]MDY4352711.1 hypothetical protein [Pseudomonas putida]